MANPEHLKILEQGVGAWNEWRAEHPDVLPDLNDADLSNLDLSNAHLNEARLVRADLIKTDLSNANLYDADLSYADLTGARLTGATLWYANLSSLNLINGDLSSADLQYANLSQAELGGADFTDARAGSTTFADNDLSEVKGLETVIHEAPSSIGLDTLYKSAGRIPEVFLRGCGVPDDFITFIPSHFGVRQALQFYSCFISYSTKDEEFARRLYSRMRDEHLRVWFAPEEMKGG